MARSSHNLDKSKVSKKSFALVGAVVLVVASLAVLCQWQDAEATPASLESKPATTIQVPNSSPGQRSVMAPVFSSATTEKSASIADKQAADIQRQIAELKKLVGLLRHPTADPSPVKPLPAIMKANQQLELLKAALSASSGKLSAGAVDQGWMIEVQIAVSTAQSFSGRADVSSVLPSLSVTSGAASINQTGLIQQPANVKKEELVTENEQKCQSLYSTHGVKPGQGWGSMTDAQINEWMMRNCDLYFCEPSSQSGKGTFSCILLKPGAPRAPVPTPRPTPLWTIPAGAKDLPVRMEGKSLQSTSDFNCDFDEMEGNGCQMRCTNNECTNAVAACSQTPECYSFEMGGLIDGKIANSWATLKKGKGRVVDVPGTLSFIRPSLLQPPSSNSVEQELQVRVEEAPRAAAEQPVSMVTSGGTGQADLIALHGQTVKYLETRLKAGKPAVHENFPNLQWSKSNWKQLGEDRSHFRSHYPLFTLQTLWDHADYIYQELVGIPGFPSSFDQNAVNKMKDGDVVYVNQCWKKWLNQVAPKLQAKITLVLFDGDSRFCESPDAKRLKNVPNVVRIFASNACPHPKVVALPLGVEDNLEFPTSFKSWTFHGDELKLAKFMRAQAQSKKHLGVFCDMSISTNPGKRKPAVAFCQQLKKNPEAGLSVNMGALANNQGKKTWESYLTTLAQHQFVVSPEGNGWDCHRTWEALLLGVIPIVQHDDGVKDVYEGLPVMFVKSWSEITHDRLEAEWNKFVSAPSGTYTYAKLFAPYWVDKMRGTSTFSNNQHEGWIYRTIGVFW